MDLAKCLGVRDLDSPRMMEVRASWRRWCAEDQALGVVAELDELPEWTRRAPRPTKHDVLARLAARTATEAEAVTALAWLLLPGATRIALELRDLHPEIDAMVAGQLWIEARGAHEMAGRGVAKAVLRRTRSAVMADLAVGDAAERRERAWARAVADGNALASLLAPESEPLADYTLLEFLKAVLLDHAAVAFDLDLLWQLAQAADRLGSPAHRGRMGLTAPAVIEAFSEQMHLNARSVRRPTTEILDRLQEYAPVRDDSEELTRWKTRHPPVVLSAREEMDLAIEEEQAWWLMTGPEHLAPEDAWARASRNVIARHARRA